MKKIIPVLVAALSLTVITAVCAAAVNEVTGKCGDNAVYIYNNETRTLTIRGEGDTYDSQPWYDKYSRIKKVIVEEGVTSVGAGAFEGCINIESVSLPESLLSVGDEAFYRCSSLRSVVLPDGVKYIGRSAFQGCTSLKELYLGKSVEHIGDYAFTGCGAERIEIPDSLSELSHNTIKCGIEFVFSKTNPYFKNENGVIYSKDMTKLYSYPMNDKNESFTVPETVKTICEFAFAWNYYLQKVVFPNGLECIERHAFVDCTELKDIRLPDSVTSIGEDAFRYCEKLEYADTGNGITEIPEGLFTGCEALKTVKISDKVRSFGRSAFYLCASLKEFTFPDSTESVGQGVFQSCSSLETVTVNSNIKPYDRRTFTGCGNLKTIYVGDNVTDFDGLFFTAQANFEVVVSENNKNFKTVDGVIYSADGAKLLHYNSCKTESEFTVPDTVTSICACAFFDEDLKKITLPDSIRSVARCAFIIADKADMDVYFEGGKPNVEEGDEPVFIHYYISNNWNRSSSTVNIYYSVYSYGWKDGLDCAGSYYGPRIKHIKYTPEDFTGIKCGDNIVCTFDLETKTLTFTGTGKIYRYSPEYPWRDLAASVEALVIGEGIEELPDKAFSGFSNLKTVTLGKIKRLENAFSLSTIKAIYYSGDLTDWLMIDFACSTNTAPGKVSENVYINGELLRSITIPENITIIPHYAFYGFDSLQYVTFHSGVKSIGEYAFRECNNLGMVEFEHEDPPDIAAFAFGKNTVIRFEYSDKWEPLRQKAGTMGGTWRFPDPDTTEEPDEETETLTEPAIDTLPASETAADSKPSETERNGPDTVITVIAVTVVIAAAAVAVVIFNKKTGGRSV